MTIEEELLYYLKRSTDLVAENKEYIRDPDFEKNYKSILEFMKMLNDVIKDKKNGGHKYDFVDYESDEMKQIIKSMKEIADGLTELGEGFN